MFSAAKKMAKCSRGEVGPACEPGASLSSIDLSNLTPKANQLRKKLTSNRLTSNEQTTKELSSDRLTLSGLTSNELTLNGLTLNNQLLMSYDDEL